MEVATKVQHTFSVSLKWDNMTNSGVMRSGKRIPIAITPPPEFGGADTAWSPEHLLAASVTSCYTTTFFYFARLFKINVRSFSLDMEMEIEKGDRGPFIANRFILHPHIQLTEAAPQELIDKLLAKTMQYCIISNSVKGEEIVKPEIEFFNG